jgi:uncharacterized protein YkwD
MKILSTLFSLVFTFVFSLTLFSALTVETNAQTGGRENNYNLKFVGDEKIASGATARPRVIENKSENKINSAAKVSAAAILEFEQRAFQLINGKRAAQNLSPLKWNEDVARIARLHSENMANINFSVIRVDGSMVDDRADFFGLRKWRLSAKTSLTIAVYAQPIEFAVERWMQSPKHKQNLLDSRWQESAIGIAVDRRRKLLFDAGFFD